MSESSGNGSATFSQPASATQGLQRYNIERGTKRLTPGLLAGRLAAVKQNSLLGALRPL